MARGVAYDRFAAHFDAWQQAFGGAYDMLVLPRLEAALGRYAPAARRAADLGVGTGDLAIALARRGLEVIGVDVSPAMLAVAAQKIAAAALPRPPALVRQDVRALRLAPPVGVAFCIYTVVNQLTADGDLSRLCAAVYAALGPAGVFVFETNRPAAYARLWTGEERVEAAGACIERRHRRLPGGLVEAQVTITTPGGAVEHDRILQRPYGDAAIEAALAGAGFVLEERQDYDPFAGGAGEPTKTLWVARAQRVRA